MPTSRRQFLAGSLGAVTAASLSAAPARHFSRYDDAAAKLLEEMSLDEKIGQMTQPDQMYLKDLDEIDKYHLGSVLSGGDSDPKAGNELLPWTEMYDQHQARALKTRLRIPLLYGVDSVHGHNNVIGAVVFPHNIGLGCMRDARLVEQAARITADETKATGMNWAFSPCVAAVQDVRWGRTYESFSESPDIVKVLGEVTVRGLQHGLNQPTSVLACAKHYVGDGGTTFGTGMLKDKNSKERYPLDRGDTRVSDEGLHDLYLPGYVTAIAAGVGSMMPSYSSINGEKCSGSHKLLTSILKEELGFEGFLISDYAAVNELPGSYKDQIERSINAGMDMVMVPDKYPEFFNLLRELVKEGKVKVTRIDDAVTRILKVKLAMGLMNTRRSQLADRNLHKSFGSDEHRSTARECVRKSVVLLKNDRKTLPIAKSAKRIHVSGKNADNVGNQCGGWTIKWQGQSGDVTRGTTILRGIRNSVGGGTQVTVSRDGTGAEGASLAIAVIGETPYAEFMGDRADLKLAPEDIATVENLKRAGVPVVAVIVSGRPLVLDPILDKCEAIVAAWLPGSEGDGVSDILFGMARPSGKLSFTWPSESSTYRRGESGYKTLYPLGHGLSY